MNGFSEDARTGAEALLPESVADHDDVLATRAKILRREHAADYGANADGFERAGSTLQRRDFQGVVVCMEDEAVQTRVIRDLDHVGEGFPVNAFQAPRLRLAARAVARALEPLRLREWHSTNHIAVQD